MSATKNYERLPQDIQRRFEDVLAHGEASDKQKKQFRDNAIERFAKLLLHKYKVREVARMLGEK